MTLKRYEVFEVPQKEKEAFAENNGKCRLAPYGMAIVLSQDDPNQIKALLETAEYCMSIVAKKLQDTRYNNGKIDDRLRTFLMQFGPWMQSFNNSRTMRELGKELYEFDEHIFDRMPRIL